MGETHVVSERTGSDPGHASTDFESSPDGSTQSPSVGERLRALRLQRGLSQRALARRSSVTNGMISLIEQDKTSPSVAVLKKVLGGFPLSLAEFFAPRGAYAAEQVFFSARQLSVLDNSHIQFRQIGGPGTTRAMQIMTETYAPGADTGEAMLSHNAEEGGFVIHGSIEVTVGECRAVLGPGDAYYFDSRLPHRFRNVGDETCKLVSACSPPSF